MVFSFAYKWLEINSNNAVMGHKDKLCLSTFFLWNQSVLRQLLVTRDA